MASAIPVNQDPSQQEIQQLYANLANTGDIDTSSPLYQRQLAEINAANNTQELGAATGAVGDLNSDNYLGAFQTAESVDPLYAANGGTTAGSLSGAYKPTSSQASVNVSYLDPVTQALESSAGLNALDPTKTWDSSDVDSYYNALLDPSVDNASLGPNPYGTWAGSGTAAQDAAANIADAPGSAPNAVQFAGLQPDQSFGDKYGGDLAALALAVVAPEIAPELAAADGAGLAATNLALGGLSGIASGTINGDPVQGSLLGLLGGLGGVLTPGLSSTIGSSTGLGAGASGALAGGVVGAGTGALRGVISGTGALQGAELGGVGGAISGGIRGSGAGTAVQNSTGLNSTVSNGLVGIGTGVLSGAARGAIDGQGAGQGAASGALSSTTGAISGSIFGSGNTIYSSGSAANPTNNQDLQNPMASFTNEDIDDSGDDPSQDYTTNQDTLDGLDNGVEGLSGSGGLSPELLAQLQQALGGSAVGAPSANDVANPNSPLALAGGGTATGGNISLSAGAGGSSSNPLSALLSALGGGASGSSTNALLSQLLGLGSTAAGGALDSAAAKSAASTFAGQTNYQPYSTTTDNGTTSFNGTNATSTLSPTTQANSDALNGLAQSSAAGLAAGPNATANSYFNNLQANQQGANQKFFQNTQDNEFGNGILGSTAGQYQSQAALGAIGQQTTADQTSANNFAQNQQQSQLAQLTGSLNGLNTINQSQVAQTQLGAQIGGIASSANNAAYQPTLAANSNSNIGNLLTGLGNGVTNSGTANASALQQYIAGLD